MTCESLFKLSCPMQESIRLAVDFAFYIELVTLDLKNGAFFTASLSHLGQDQSLLRHVLLNLFDCLVSV